MGADQTDACVLARPAGRLARLLAGASSLLLAALVGSAAHAQTSADPVQSLEEVVVTGSRIRGVAPVGANVVSVSQEDLQKSGVNTTTDLIRQVPQINNIGFSETGGSTQGGASNTSRANGINIRGLGPAATLTLVNSRRVVPMGVQGQLVDPTMIPTLALERVEVVPDGSSAIYGSDAIAGVVNFITRRNFQGLELQARYGSASDYYDYQYAFIAGYSSDRLRAVVAGEHSGHSDLIAADRRYITSDQRPFGGVDFRSNQCAPGNILVGTQVFPIPPGGATPTTPLTAGAPNLCDNSQFGGVLPEIMRTSFTGSLEVDVTDSIRLFAEGIGSRRDFTTRFGPPVANLTVPRSNPFFVSPVPGAASVQVAYLLGADVGTIFSSGYALTKQGTVGARFDLPKTWKGEASYTYGESNERETSRPTLSPAALSAALANPNPALAFNPFGAGGISNPATVASLYTAVFLPFGEPKLESWNVGADGPVLTLPGGAVRLAIGAEYRDESFYGGLFAGPATSPVEQSFRASRNIKSMYGELFVPLIGSGNAMPFAQALNLSLAVRREDYSDFGTTTNPKFGATWTVIDGLSLRGTWSKSFRAPTFQENNLKSSGFGIYPQNFRDPLSPTGFSTGFSIAGGNPDVKPETAKTWTIGAEFQPKAIPGLRISATYYDIDYNKQIFQLQGVATVLQTPEYAPYVIRNPTPAQIAAVLNTGGSPVPINGVLPPSIQFIVDGRRQNFGTTIARGVDYDIRYQWTSSLGDFNVGLAGTHFTKFANSFAPQAAQRDVLGLINWPQQDRFRGEFGWRKGAVRAAIFANYVSDYQNNTVTPSYKIDGWLTWDLNVAVDLDRWVDDSRISLNVLNLTDKDPPHSNTVQGYDPQASSAVGRLVAITLNKRF